MNILIVDDSRFLRLANERALVRAGHSLISASDGEEGLRLARERMPDLIVLDMYAAEVVRSGSTTCLARRSANGPHACDGADQPATVQRRQIESRRRYLLSPEGVAGTR